MPHREGNAIVFSAAETVALFGPICTCGTLLPTWEWAKRKAIAEGKTCECATGPSQEDYNGRREEHTPPDWKPKWWGVKQIVVNSGAARWYTNDRHRKDDAEDLARHYIQHSAVDLHGQAVIYRPVPIMDGEKY